MFSWCALSCAPSYSGNLFGVVEPKAGRRFTIATPNRTAAQFAGAVNRMVAQYAAAQTIHLVMDTLNIHCRKSLVDFFGKPKGGNLWGPAHATLHPQTPKLAESGGDRAQPVLAAMPRPATEAGVGHVAAGHAGLEPHDRPSTDRDRLAVHAQEGPEGVPL